MDKYLNIDSARTSSGNTFHTEVVPKGYLLDALHALKVVSADIDQGKKGLFYGKDTDRLQFVRTAMGQIPNEYGNVNVDLVHAILGILTEAHELAEVLALHLINPGENTVEALKAKLVDESGDGMWYQALLFRTLGVTFEEVADKNTAKLLVRFPPDQGFSEDSAIHHNETAENAVFQ